MVSTTWHNKVHFYGQLRSILRGGLALDQSLQLAAGKGSGYAPFRDRIYQHVESGNPLHSALEAIGETPLVCALIKAGERSGRLPDMCQEIETFYQHAINVRRIIIGRSIYPILLIHVAMIIPGLVPVITQGAPIYSLFIGPLMLWLVVLGIVLFFKFSQKTGFAARMALLPGIRAISQQLVTSNTALILKAGSSAGMLYHESLEMAAECCGNSVLGAELQQQARALMEGTVPNLSTALGNIHYPSDMLNIVRNAEQTGTMEEGLGQIAFLSRERFQERATWTARIVTGTLIFIAMLFAAYTIISMFFTVYIVPLRELTQ